MDYKKYEFSRTHYGDYRTSYLVGTMIKGDLLFFNQMNVRHKIN